MQISTTEIIALSSTLSVAIGYTARHFIPILIYSFRSNKNGKGTPPPSTKNSDRFLSITEHSALCEPIKEKLKEGSNQFNAFKNTIDEISVQIRWIRALAVVQSTPDAIKKANEIIGNEG